jgi:outer membrane protein assembly factor BamB
MTTDGRRVYVMFANGDLAAFTLDGAPVWSKNLGVPKNTYGHSTSLATWQGRLIVQFDQGEGEPEGSKLLAFDGATGRLVWQTPRAVHASWASPIVVEAAGKPQIIALAVPWVMAYAATDGNEIWRVECLEGEICPSPVFAGGLVLAVSPNNKLNAIRPDGRGDVTKTHVAWGAEDNQPDVTSPTANGELLFTVTTPGVLTCFDVKDGKKLWEKELEMDFHASPSLVGSRLLLVSKKGVAIVFAAAREFKELARSAELGEEVHASPAFASGRMFIRGMKHLYCIGGGGTAPQGQNANSRGRQPTERSAKAADPGGVAP